MNYSLMGKQGFIESPRGDFCEQVGATGDGSLVVGLPDDVQQSLRQNLHSSALHEFQIPSPLNVT